MPPQATLLSVIIPMYQEEEVAVPCYDRMSSVLTGLGMRFEIIYINDGSSDRTPEILADIAARDERVKVINFSRNFGHQIAISAGLDFARGDVVVIIDADLQDPPELIGDMLQYWRQNYHVVYARRRARKGETWLKLVSAKYFYRLLSVLTDVTIPVDVGDYRLLDRKVVTVLKNMPEKHRFVRGMVSWVGFRQIAVDYVRDKRYAGETKYGLQKTLKFALDGIFSFSSKPLKLIGILGLFTMMAALAVFLLALISWVRSRGQLVPGWATLMAAVIFLGGVQLVALGILGEYMARIYDESKNRPLYIINSTRNIDSQTGDREGSN
ncbi:glycosyltransferase family 2 protein [candidate division CSSED10-310 bacterium]|uniref:Glycosyltransferase family 2 protein n=1 Tax=candidate division CSSED10-310 bacterium TaxID=2855610 RepID=A0ABV6Z6P6_UNCC1